MDARASACASARRPRPHCLSEFLNRVTDGGGDLSRSDDLRCENSRLAIALKPRVQRGLLCFEALDTFEQRAGRFYQLFSDVSIQ